MKMWVAWYITKNDTVDFIGVFDTVDKAKEAIIWTLTENCAPLDYDFNTGDILSDFSDRYMLDDCTVNKNYCNRY